jgi:membrane-bound serine protease (ClpP class)
MVVRHRRLIGAVSVVVLVVGLICLFLLPHPWSGVGFASAFVSEIAYVVFFVWYLRRGRAQVGTETLIGRSALVITACFPTGQVKVGGETWIARCEAGATFGEKVRVRAVDGLTLVVEREKAS